MRIKSLLSHFSSLFLLTGAFADIEQGRTLYTQFCAGCHGLNHEGGPGGSLVNNPYKQVGKTVNFLDFVKNGNLQVGMPPFGAALSDVQISSIEAYITDQKSGKGAAAKDPVGKNQDLEKKNSFVVEEFFTVEEIIWSIDFFPNDAGGIVTERSGSVYTFDSLGNTTKISGVPAVLTGRPKGEQGGMLEVAVHPDYAVNGWVYLAYSHQQGGENKGMTRIVRGKIKESAWTDQEVIYQADPKFYTERTIHWGVRMVIKNGYIYFGIGDRGRSAWAQDLSRPQGKIHRLHDDGRIPEDNPFVDEPGAIDSVWAYGVRNPQGLDLNPFTGKIWESEHGPKGGDEINIIEKGKNYGWPEITYGVNYNGTPITDKTSAPGMEQPKHYWVPSIAVCGIDFYEGDQFPDWKGDLLVTGLTKREVQRLDVEEGEVVGVSTLWEGPARIRDVASGPDGYIYVLRNYPGTVYRLKPH